MSAAVKAGEAAGRLVDVAVDAEPVGAGKMAVGVGTTVTEHS